MPGGVLNAHEDTDNEDEYFADQAEVRCEMDALKVAESHVNVKSWNYQREGIGRTSSGHEVDLRLDWAAAKAILKQGSEDAVEDEEKSLSAAEVAEKYPLDILDPTQRCFADRVLAWAGEVVQCYSDVCARRKRCAPPPLRAWVGGSAGSGKSTVLKTCVAHIRVMFQTANVPATVALTAYTGVAAFNIGFGAKTACSMFSVFPNVSWKAELAGDALSRLEAQWANVILLIVDEISFIGSAFLAKMHARMQQGKREQLGKEHDQSTFGGCSLLLFGDFGQLEPIDDLPIVNLKWRHADASKAVKRIWKEVQKGRNLIRSIKEAWLLKRIHRSKDDLWWTESCLRLRDFTCTLQEDWESWLLHDLDRGHLNEQQKMYFENHAVWLCSKSEDVGKRNGRKLAAMALDEVRVIHQIYADHSHKKGREKSSGFFDGLRPVVNLVRGCKVMITKNIAYRYGLANGARGTVIGVVYDKRGMGYMPEAVITEVPSYCGPPFYDGEPKWVPIMPATHKGSKSTMSRTQLPLVAAFAMTVNKAQGLTLKEGVVIHLNGNSKFKPAGKHGLPFVAFTRSECFAMTAFKNLPPFQEFQRGQASELLELRLGFMKILERLHRDTWQKYGRVDEAEAHKSWKPKPKTKDVAEEAFRLACPCCEDAWGGG